ncbi:MAG TPA: hypothetical protein PKC73_00685 [Dermatophilaceae bacterium]|jgi:hypothetical protein|nr:hypothetical protein [Dermatophilaceae bacterium]
MDKTVPIVKLTDLPVGTVINDQEHGRYELTSFGSNDPYRVWMELYPHCVDCGELVPEKDEFKLYPGMGNLIGTHAPEYFSNWSVALVPPDINEDLLDQINKFNAAQIARPHHG